MGADCVDERTEIHTELCAFFFYLNLLFNSSNSLVFVKSLLANE